MRTGADSVKNIIMSDESLMRHSVHGDLGVLCVLDLTGSQQLTVA